MEGGSGAQPGLPAGRGAGSLPRVGIALSSKLASQPLSWLQVLGPFLGTIRNIFDVSLPKSLHFTNKETEAQEKGQSQLLLVP